MHALGHRAVTAILLAPFAILALDWARREPGDVPCGDTRPRDEWLSGLAPAAFVTGCVCLVVLLRLSAEQRGGRAGTPTLVATAAWFVCAIAWWTGGEDSPVGLWASIAYLLLIPAVPAALTLVVVIELRRDWLAVRGLAWLCAIVLVPGFVGVIEMWGVDVYC